MLERLAAEHAVRGFIVAPDTDTPHAQDVVQWLAECGLPSVFVEREAVVLPGREPVENVTTDHALGAVLAARHPAGAWGTARSASSSRATPPPAARSSAAGRRAPS